MARFLLETDTLHVEAEGNAETIVRLAHTLTEGLVPVRADPATVGPTDFTIDGDTVTIDDEGDYMICNAIKTTFLTDIINSTWWDWESSALVQDAGEAHILALRSILSAQAAGHAVEGPIAAAREAIDRA